MDAFFASVEQRDFPELRGKPIAVGGSKERGVVAAASYEARKFGVHSAMPSVTAARLCPDLIFVKHRFEVYKEVSSQIHDIFHRYTDIIEPLSLDEAYLDVTENKKGIRSATEIAQEIRKAIKDELDLTASAGISTNKFLAKVASDYNKPDGYYVIPPKKVRAFIEGLPIEKFFGVGKVTAVKMHEYGIFHGRDLLRYSEGELSMMFGKSGSYYYNVSRGEDNRQVNPHRIRKSVGAENTFEKDIVNRFDVETELTKMTTKAWERLQRSQKEAKTVTIKLKFSDFTQITRSKTQINYFNSSEEVQLLVKELLNHEQDLNPIRLLGITFSNFKGEGFEPFQLTLEF